MFSNEIIENYAYYMQDPQNDHLRMFVKVSRNEDGTFTITSISKKRTPIRPHALEIMGMRPIPENTIICDIKSLQTSL